MVFGGHRDGAGPEQFKGGVAGKDGGVLGVDVEEVELAGAGEKGGLDAAEELAQERGLKGMEEVQECRCYGHWRFQGITAQERDGAKQFWHTLSDGFRAPGEVEVTLGDAGELRIEFDAENLLKRRLGGNEHSASLAGTNVQKGIAIEREGRRGAVLPEVEERPENGRGDPVVRGYVAVGGVAGEEVVTGNKAARVCAAKLIEGVGGCGGGTAGIRDELRDPG